MNKPIEEIWRDGFLKSDPLVAPKINNLYQQKSINIIDKFKSMFKKNIITIVISSFVILGASYYVGIPLMGIIFFVTLMVMVTINKKLLNELNRIDKAQNSYQYLYDFNHWVRKQIMINRKMATFLYPIIFSSIVIGCWFKDLGDILLGEKLVQEILIGFPDTLLIYGIPLIVIIILTLIMGLLAFFGGRIYQWDLNIIYGRVLKKLDQLLTDLEDLKN